MGAALKGHEILFGVDVARHEERIRGHRMAGGRRHLAHCETVGLGLGQQLLERSDGRVAPHDDDRAVTRRAGRVDQLAEHLDIRFFDAVERRFVRQPGELGPVGHQRVDRRAVGRRVVALHVEPGGGAQVGEEGLPGGAGFVDRGGGDDGKHQRRRLCGSPAWQAERCGRGEQRKFQQLTAHSYDFSAGVAPNARIIGAVRRRSLLCFRR
jgi:hypothetical protein